MEGGGGARFLSKNYMKLKEIGPRGGVHPWRPHGSVNGMNLSDIIF